MSGQDRDEWALQTHTDGSDFWITLYSRLLSVCDELRTEMADASEGMDAAALARTLSVDIPAIDRHIARYQARLQHWQRVH